MDKWINRIMMACVLGFTIMCGFGAFYTYTHIPTSLTMGDIQRYILLAWTAFWFSSALLIISTFSYASAALELRSLKKKVGSR